MAQRDPPDPDARKKPLQIITAKIQRVAEEQLQSSCKDTGEEEDGTALRPSRGNYEIPASAEEGDTPFMAMLRDLGLTKSYPQRITLNSVLQISQTALSGKTPTSLIDIPMHFLHNLIRASTDARNTKCDSGEVRWKSLQFVQKTKKFILGRKENQEVDSISILDLITAVFLCSDSLLQQALMAKMSLCKFALPLLLPNASEGSVTFLLWAMRTVVHKWTPQSKEASKGYAEQAMVTTPMPIISFMRIGESRTSKSEVINSILSKDKHDFFVHRKMECGKFPRRLCNGLVEVCCHLPCGTPAVDVFSDIFAVLNLRGDVRDSPVQLRFLKDTSDAVFIFAERIGRKECDFLTSSFDQKSRLFFVIHPDEQHIEETEGYLNIVLDKLDIPEDNILVQDTDLKESIRKILGTDSYYSQTFETMSEIARRSGINIDEDDVECRRGQGLADSIVNEIKMEDIELFKATTFPAQGKLLKEWSDKDKEQHRLKHRGKKDIKEYREQLDGEKRALRKRQSDIVLSGIVNTFISACLHLPEKTKMILLQWIKMKLDDVSTKTLIPLQETLKQHSSDDNRNKEEFTKITTKIAHSSLGLEHFMREVGQIYEASKASNRNPQFLKLPSVMARLLINGFPMELMDGDAGSIPLEWVTDVFTEVRSQLGKDPRVCVLSVLGVQSTGKSTLLNIMFGLQFAVSSGRCTRGAFMQLLRIDDTLKKGLGFDFLLVIDTEGLKAPQLESLVDSYEHDNELATLVIGLSDVTIINLGSENAQEMKDILQIVVHALLRMKEAGKKTNCLFVHQNSGDVSAAGKNLTDRRHLLNQLDEMTRAAARMEHKAMYYDKFTDVIAYDMSKDNWFIPGLWSGSSAMAPVGLRYTEQVFQLKTYIFEILKQRQLQKPCTLSELSEWIGMIWHSVKRETYVFSFRNVLVIEAYDKLSTMYIRLVRKFLREVISWTQEAQNIIMNASQEALCDTYEGLKREGREELNKHRITLLNDVNDYFSQPSADTCLIKKFNQDFILSAKHLAEQTQAEMFDKCQETFCRKESRIAFDKLQSQYTETISQNVKDLLEICRNIGKRLTEEEIRVKFEDMWSKTISNIPQEVFKKQNVTEAMETILRQHTRQHEALVNEKIRDSSFFREEALRFQVKPEHISDKFAEASELLNDSISELTALSQNIIEECRDFIRSKTSSNSEYLSNFWHRLLEIADSLLQKASAEKVYFSNHFLIDIKLHICALAIGPFTTLHEHFITANNPWSQLPAMKEKYCKIFTEMYMIGDTKQTNITIFSNQSLKPALMKLIENQLGHKIVEDITSQCPYFLNRKTLEYYLLSDLLDKHAFKEYTAFLTNHHQYTREWTNQHIIEYGRKDNHIVTLYETILKEICEKADKALDSLLNQPVPIKVVDVFLKLKQSLERDIVMPMDGIGRISSFELKDSQHVKDFHEEIIKGIDQTRNDIITNLGKDSVESMLEKIAVKPDEELLKLLAGCGKTCPLCKVPCDRAGSDHQEHAATLHYPQGLCGHTWSTPGKLSAEVCTTSVSKTFLYYFKIQKFYNTDKHGKPVRYADYRTVNDYYASWDIPEDPNLEAPLFWKFVFYQFNSDFAKLVGAEPADIPPKWKSITKEDVKAQLKTFYGVL